MTDFDPVERYLNRHLKEEERSEASQAAMDHEYTEVWNENFEPWYEDEKALEDALADYMAEHCKEGELAKHILHAEYGLARAIVEDAIKEWCESAAEMRVEAKKREAEEEMGKSNAATWRRNR